MIEFSRLFFTSFMIIAFYLTLTPAQKPDAASISPEILKKIEQSITIDDQTRAMINAVSNNDLRKLALNRQVMEKVDHNFAYRIKTGKVTNQKSTGRCWLFTALNVLRPAIMKRYQLDNFEFSENYLFFWDQLEKSNRFLEGVIATRDKKVDDRMVEWLFKHPVDDGGVWSMMGSLMKKYGAVPREAMLESHHSENTSTMNRLLAGKLREGGYQIRQLHEKRQDLKALQEKKVEILTEIYRILIISLGEPPKQFTWRYVDTGKNLSPTRTYTPQEFYQEYIKTDLEGYVMMMNDPTKEYNKLYEIEYDRNVWEGPNWTFVNLPVDELKWFAKKSILADEPMYFSCDVGKQLHREAGFLIPGIYDYASLFGVTFGMDKAARILTWESGSTHGMALMGVDTSATGEPTKWLLENSWGKDAGNEGYLTMTQEWFNEYSFRLVVHRNFVSQKVLKILDSKPILLPPWDPMF